MRIVSCGRGTPVGIRNQNEALPLERASRCLNGLGLENVYKKALLNIFLSCDHPLHLMDCEGFFPP